MTKFNFLKNRAVPEVDISRPDRRSRRPGVAILAAKLQRENPKLSERAALDKAKAMFLDKTAASHLANIDNYDIASELHAPARAGSRKVAA